LIVKFKSRFEFWQANSVLVILLLLIIPFTGKAQNFPISTATVTTCFGIFTDDGVGSAYVTGTNYTFTICPDVPGDVISVEFAAFSLYTSPNPQNSDYLQIFDGNNIGAASLGDYTGTSLQGLPVTGTVNNTSGCLTFVFNSNPNAPGSAPGWEANIVCTTPCDPPTSASAILDPIPQSDIQTVGVCLDQPVTFTDLGSAAAPTFSLQYWVWNYDDGTIDSLTSAENAVHTFTEPGEYLVSLSVIDNNGCRSLNLDPLQVLVSTIPIFNTAFNSPVCLDEPVPIDGNAIQNVTWTALPPQVVSGQTYLADGAGFQYTTNITFDFFEPGAILENCSDLDEIYVNIEHSFLGDLNMTITCPNGTVVSLLDWPNGGGGTFLGSAVDNDPNQDPGIGATYGWTPGNTNGNLADVPTIPVGGTGLLTPGNGVPAGTFQSDNDICALVGCPLNGDWSFGVGDNLGADNGYIFFWGIDFNPSLFPDITTFTPVTGLGIDSSGWTGPNIINTSPNGNLITTLYTTPGFYDYTFTATNNFGCAFDTTITVEAIQGPVITAGPDLFTCGGPIQLQAGLAGDQPPSCGSDTGNYTYCYNNNDNIVVTFCPDTPGDGITSMSIEILSGALEAFFDGLIIYNGDNTGAPILYDYFFGGIVGTVVTATGPTGCLTFQIFSDGSVSCGNGNFNPIEISVSCVSGSNDLIWAWSPATGLSNPNVQNPTSQVSQATLYTVTAYPPGLPGCLISDQVIVAPDPTADPGLDTDTILCYNSPVNALISLMNGAPAPGGTWTNEVGVPVSAVINPTNYPDGQTFIYTYTVGNTICTNTAQLNITILASTNTSCCQTNAQVGPDVTACGLTWQLDAEPALGVGVWTGPPQVSFSNINDPNAIATCLSPGGAMALTWTDFNGFLCEGSDDLVVNFADSLELIVVTEDALCNNECSGSAVAIPDGGTTNGGGYIYDWGMDNGVPGIIPQTRDSLCAGTFLVKVFDQLGCKDSLEFSVGQPNAQTMLLNKIQPRCYGECNGQLVVNSPAATSYSFNGGETFGNSNAGVVCAGSFEVIAKNANGCEISELVILPDPEEYVANFNVNPNITTTKNTTVVFQDVSFPGPVGTSLFTFGNPPIGESEDRIATFVFPRDTSGNYPVTLITANQNGCLDTLTKVLEIRDDLLYYIPNSFSPNEDGINDIWHPVGNTLDIEFYSLTITDRWGRQVFQTNDYDKGWNGSLNGGDYYVDADVYVYLIKLTSATTKDKFELTGSIMLLR